MQRVQTTNELLLFPAYGRKYATKDKALADWKAEKDFKIYEGPYCSIRDIDLMSQMTDKILVKTEQGWLQVFPA